MDVAAPLSRSFDRVAAPVGGRKVAILRGLVMAAVAVVVGWRLTVPSGSPPQPWARWAGPARRPAEPAAGQGSGNAALGAARSFRRGAFPRLPSGAGLRRQRAARLSLGPVPALHLGEALLWIGLVLPVVFALRFAAARSETMAVVEVVAVGGALRSAFAAHREGMVHRPLAVGDWAWSRGLDPLWIFLGVGLAGTFLLAGLMIHEAAQPSGSRSISACCC